MKLSCLQENLIEGLNVVRKAVAKRSSLPVLSHIRLTTDEGRLKLSATDLETGINCWVGAKVEEEGATTVPANSFVDLVRTLPEERIDLELEKKTETLKLKCRQLKANFKGITAEEFPIIPTAEDMKSIDKDLFQEMINQVALAAGTDEWRPVLTGVLMKFDQDKLTMAAADGFRLSVRSVELPIFGEDRSVIVPAHALKEAASLKAEGLQLNENQVIFGGQDFNLVSQLIEGKFPDYEQMIPKKFTTEVSVDNASFLSVCKRVQIFAREANEIIRLKIEPNEIHLSSSSTEYGDVRDILPAVVTGEPLEIAFNVKYLIDFLSVMPLGSVLLKMDGSSASMMMIPDDPDMDWVTITMPMHINQ